MIVQDNAARAEGHARRSRRSDGDLALENARLSRQLCALWALCEQQQRDLLRLTEMRWQMRQEAVEAEVRPAELRDGARVYAGFDESAREIGLMADQHRLGIPT